MKSVVQTNHSLHPKNNDLRKSQEWLFFLSNSSLCGCKKSRCHKYCQCSLCEKILGDVVEPSPFFHAKEMYTMHQILKTT